MPAPHTSAPSSTSGTDALLYCLFAVVGLALGFGTLAWLSGNATNALVGQGPWTGFKPGDALLHPDALWPHLSHDALLIGARIIPGLLFIAGTSFGVGLWLSRWGGSKNGLARKQELAPLLDREITAKAKSLRPSLNGRECKRGRPQRPRNPRRHPLPGTC